MTKPIFSNIFPWASITRMAMQNAMLTMEAQQVIALRLTKMAMGGPGVDREARLMVSEKMETMAESGRVMTMAALGGTHDMGAEKVMKLYRSKVRANRKRLSG